MVGCIISKRAICLSVAMLVCCETQVYLGSSATRAQEPWARFDVPAVVEAIPIASDLDASQRPRERVIQLLLPVSSWMEPERRDQVSEFRFDVTWLSNAWSLVDYQPRTLMQTGIDGLISVEQHEQSAGKLHLTTAPLTAAFSASGNLEVSGNKNAITKMSKLPPAELLVASGTVQRGTGAFFRFHASPQYALEGSRDLLLQYRVPLSWRGGMIRVTCQAIGRRNLIAGMTDLNSEVTSFLVPVYLAEDISAEEVAWQHVQAERLLRASWRQYRQQKSSGTSAGWLRWPDQQTAQTAARWIDEFLQSAKVEVPAASTKSLPPEVRRAALDLAASRKHLSELSR
jgi:hypothetical protein